MTDIEVINEGTIFLVRPLTEDGKDWIFFNLPEDAMMFGSATVVEHRYIEDIVEAMINDGLEVE